MVVHFPASELLVYREMVHIWIKSTCQDDMMTTGDFKHQPVIFISVPGGLFGLVLPRAPRARDGVTWDFVRQVISQVANEHVGGGTLYVTYI